MKLKSRTCFYKIKHGMDLLFHQLFENREKFTVTNT